MAILSIIQSGLRCYGTCCPYKVPGLQSRTLQDMHATTCFICEALRTHSGFFYEDTKQ